MKRLLICLAVVATQSAVSLGDVLDYNWLAGSLENFESYEGTDWPGGGEILTGGFDDVSASGAALIPGSYSMFEGGPGSLNGHSSTIEIGDKSIDVSSSLYSGNRFFGDLDFHWESVAGASVMLNQVGFTLSETMSFELQTMYSATAGEGSFEIFRTDDDVLVYSGDSGSGTMDVDTTIELIAGSYRFGVPQSIATEHVYDSALEYDDESHLTASLRVVPAPSGFGLLVVSGLVATRRRR